MVSCCTLSFNPVTTNRTLVSCCTLSFNPVTTNRKLVSCYTLSFNPVTTNRTLVSCYTLSFNPVTTNWTLVSSFKKCYRTKANMCESTKYCTAYGQLLLVADLFACTFGVTDLLQCHSTNSARLFVCVCSSFLMFLAKWLEN